MKGKKPLPPLGLDMPFDEALRRFIGTDPKELAESIEAEKKSREATKKANRETEDSNEIDPLG